jgi:hypothetical protein
VENADRRRSKSEDGNEGPASKKMKHHAVVQFYEEDYDKQVGLKWLDLCMVRFLRWRFLYC